MKIAFIGTKGLPAKGGGERVVEAIIERLIKNGYDVTIYGKNKYCEPKNIPHEINLIIIRTFRGKHLNAFSFGLFSALHAIYFGNYDLIHLHYADFGYLAPLLRLKFRVIGTSHGSEYKRDKWNILAKYFFRISEILFIKYCNVCTSVSLSLARHYSMKYNKDIVYIPNGVDTKNLDINQIDNKHNDYILFLAGRIIPTKGLHILLKANIMLKNKLPIIIAGEIEDKKYKKELMKLNDTNVNYLGFIKSEDELYELISNCRIFVFPSQYEAMSMALLEVAAQGKMIICSDIDENFDTIENNAIYFKTNDHEDLAKKIDMICLNDSITKKYSKRTYRWIKENRNWDNIINDYSDNYINLVNI